jgi:hypothetical protein
LQRAPCCYKQHCSACKDIYYCASCDREDAFCETCISTCPFKCKVANFMCPDCAEVHKIYCNRRPKKGVILPDIELFVSGIAPKGTERAESILTAYHRLHPKKGNSRVQ